jgi:hypothetical protein
MLPTINHLSFWVLVGEAKQSVNKFEEFTDYQIKFVF